MKRNKILSVLFTAIMLTALPQTANAQLGKILGKVKKTAEKVIGTTEQTTNNSNAKVVAVTQDDGVTVENPKSSHYEVQLVGAYGHSTSLNYGEVELVLKVKMIDNEQTLSFGGRRDNAPCYMIDGDGNKYEMESGWYNFTVTEGMYVKINLKDKGLVFKDVKKTASTIQLIRLTAGGSFNDGCAILFRNVPIQWDVEPE